MPTKESMNEALPDWLKEALVTSTYSWSAMVVRVLAATAMGLVVAFIFRLTHGRLSRDSRMMSTTLVLLTILICLVTLIIRDNVARAFSLVGALSIVRFRTVVQDTRDTAFVILAVTVGMAAGTGLLALPCLALPLIGVVSLVMNRGSLDSIAAKQNSGRLTCRLALGISAEQSVLPVLGRWSVTAKTMAVETSRQGSAIDVTYRVFLRNPADVPAIVAELNRVEGIQHVELQLLD